MNPTSEATIKTELGDIRVDVHTDKAPITSANFMRYVDAGLYNSTTFFRTVTIDNQPNNDVKIEVIQGGQVDKEKEYQPIEHETTEKTGLKHLDGVISMGRFKPGSASSSFFICINDQPELDFNGKRNADGQGFSAFGQVISGMEVVRLIHKQPREGQRLQPPIKIVSIFRI